MEGDEDIRFIVTLSLNLDDSIEHHAASSPREALTRLRDTEWRPDCVLLDAPMPDGENHALLAEIRRLPGMADTPVIFLTGAVRQSEIESHMAAGATGVIAKPFDPLTLAEQIREIAAEKAGAGS